MLVSFLQHDDEYDKDIPTDDLPTDKSSFGILGVCHHSDDDAGDDNIDDEYFLNGHQAQILPELILMKLIL